MKRLGSISQDVALAVAGLIVLAIGLALVSIPAALVVVGGLLLAYAVWPDQKPTGGTS